MKKIIFISARFIIALLILSSCKSIKSVDFIIKPDDDISKLSNLSIKFDENNLTSRYSISTSVASSYSNNRSAVGTGTSFLDKRVEDFKLICDRETKENLCVLGKPNGTINYKIITAETKNTGIGWSILSGVTLGIPNLFGMPFGRLKTEMILF